MLLLATFPVSAAAGLTAFAAYAWPKGFQPYSETLRNLSLVMGTILLAWNLAVALTVLALESGGLLIVGGFFEAKRIEESLILFGPLTVIASSGGAWLYLAALDRWLSQPRAGLTSAGQP